MTNTAKRKSWREEFTRFFESPTRDALRGLLQATLGESDECDFKTKWIEDSSLARHVLAIANSGGGCLMFGVRQDSDGDLHMDGLTVLREKSEVAKGIRNFIPDSLRMMTLDFSYTAAEYPALVGKKFQVLMIESDDAHLPYVARKNGADLKEATIYVRRGTESVQCNHEELQRLLDARVKTGYSEAPAVELQEYLSQLDTLYSEHRRHAPFLALPLLGDLFKAGVPGVGTDSESYQEFLERLIVAKKKIILRSLSVEESDLPAPSGRVPPPLADIPPFGSLKDVTSALPAGSPTPGG